MTMTLKSIRALPVKKRYEIVDQILESIPDQAISPSFQRELQRRYDEMERNPKLGRTWAEIKKSLRKR